MCISFTFTCLSKSALCITRFHLVWSAGKIRTSGQRNHPSMEANRIYCSRLGRESFWSAYLQYNINDNPAKKHAINTTPSINFRQCSSIYIRYTTICLKTRDIDGQRYVAIYIAHLWFRTSWLFLNIKNKKFGKIWIQIFLPKNTKKI